MQATSKIKKGILLCAGFLFYDIGKFSELPIS